MSSKADVLFFEDIRPGDVIEGASEFALDADGIKAFARAWDPQPFHLDDEAAARSIHGGLTASGVHLMAIRSWLMHHMGTPFAIVASLGTDDTRIHHPARPGDRLSLRLTWNEARPSRSRPGLGVVAMQTEVLNQAGTLVLSAVERILVRRRRVED